MDEMADHFGDGAPGRRGRVTRVVAVAAFVATLGVWMVGVVFAVLNGDAVDVVLSVATVAFAGVGVVVMWQRPQHRLGWLFCAVAAAMAVAGGTGAYARRALVVAPGSWPGGEFAAWLSDLMAAVIVGLLAGVLPQLFPTGALLSRRWRLAVGAGLGYIVLGGIGNAFYSQPLESVAGYPNPYAIESAETLFAVLIGLAGLCGAVALVAGVVTLVLRWRRAHGDERQQLKWFLAGIVLLPAPLLLHDLNHAAADAAISIVLMVLAATMAVAILRYRLYDLDLVVNRSLVYALVSALVAGVYLVVVGVGAAVVGGGVPLGVHVLAAVVAAIALQAVRAHVQRGVDRVFYGDRAHPYEAVARLGRRLEAALDPETVLPGVAETVTEALRLPYAAIELRDGEQWTLAARHGQPTGDEVRFPMIYQADTIGRLVVNHRTAGDPFTNADRRLLEDLARHAGVASHGVRVTLALQRSRAELVAAREEERRRLRRDLHDGLGPTLAGITLGLHAARVRLRDELDGADDLLAGIETQIEDAVADIRRLVYGLRPPALDEYGLVRAVQLHASRLDGADDLAVAVDAPPEGLGRLPAATEVAAYRIITEALTNVARHAAAGVCSVRFALNGALEIEIRDDGHGIRPDDHAGVGLTAMRERAEELGGTLTIDSSRAGTRIAARLPVPQPT